MKPNSFFELLGLTVIAVILIDILTSKNTAGNVKAGGDAWSGILKTIQSSQGK